MKAGTLVRLPDGRVGRVVYNGLDGRGIRWGSDPVDVEAIMRGSGGLFADDTGDAASLGPQAMLRAPYNGCNPTLEYVGDEYEVVEGE